MDTILIKQVLKHTKALHEHGTNVVRTWYEPGSYFSLCCCLLSYTEKTLQVGRILLYRLVMYCNYTKIALQVLQILLI